MTIDWSRAVIQKTADAKGKSMQRIIYKDEKSGCSKCVFFKKDKVRNNIHYSCTIKPEFELREWTIACVELKPIKT